MCLIKWLLFPAGEAELCEGGLCSTGGFGSLAVEQGEQPGQAQLPVSLCRGDSREGQKGSSGIGAVPRRGPGGTTGRCGKQTKILLRGFLCSSIEIQVRITQGTACPFGLSQEQHFPRPLHVTALGGQRGAGEPLYPHGHGDMARTPLCSCGVLSCTSVRLRPATAWAWPAARPGGQGWQCHPCARLCRGPSPNSPTPVSQSQLPNPCSSPRLCSSILPGWV